MQAEIRTHEDQLVTEFVDRMNGAGDGPAARESYRDGFTRLRAQFDLYPPSGRPASAVFESAARTARTLAASSLPLGIAVAMHLYPLCVLQCMPLPLLSFARLQRAVLLRTIRNRSLILANAGSERTRGAAPSLVARLDTDGVRIDGTFEYMSLATVADVVLFKARLADGNGTVLCAADLRADTVRIGGWRFSGSMRLSDTSSVTFAGHRVARGRYVLVANDETVRCASDYQRCWFHLFLADIYLARLERLHRVWGLPRPAEQVMSLNELSRLREYALRLLDDFSPGSDIDPLKKTTSAMKLRVSLMAESTRSSLRDRESRAPAEAQRLRADAGELGYIKSQPTADEIILRSIGVPPQPVPHEARPGRQGPWASMTTAAPTDERISRRQACYAVGKPRGPFGPSTRFGGVHRMPPTPHVEYMGFENRETTRDYRLVVRHADGQHYQFILVVEQEAFRTGRVRYQDAAEICFWKLQRELVAWDLAPDSAPPASRQKVTEADLLEYKDTHAGKPRRFLAPSGAA